MEGRSDIFFSFSRELVLRSRAKAVVSVTLLRPPASEYAGGSRKRFTP
jgi:hypothetical protein